jgi:hypothetical protein
MAAATCSLLVPDTQAGIQRMTLTRPGDHRPKRRGGTTSANRLPTGAGARSPRGRGLNPMFASAAAWTERELTSLRATNEGLRPQITLMGDSYMKFATSCATQLQLIDDAIKGMEKGGTGSPDLRAIEQ